MTIPVAVVMGSQSDWETMKEACDALSQFGVGWKAEVVSAHRTPKRLVEFAETAVDQGYQVIVAGAGGAAHLPGMIASMTPLPVLGVPVKSRALSGLDSLLSIVQMPKGVAVGTLAIGAAGAWNAGLLAAQMLAARDPDLLKRIADWKTSRADQVLADAHLGQESFE
ncbi:5-(carboxyamino)imidazole ribonucleotide mutase [Alloalcanivorax gelatiniphagus]|uniref:N5-carboxyaminoimidazole ribonucleotide mutase n=1 Tax=Alloalcanivorax gelatiniphagus TaxID=1194167 RepID=A0ABY2XIN0_9GAMM|nr:5-(carboxyamino)imidazole ribonucleotide mutase [Alloalcanivorax gelatiniphagus]TMW10906.1 5-(carboxyamino)imidazole ribonucleotide mutase [Alloalcanivorax gelatiniphagus]|tara:strand:+ start:3170 stop:3670 length:501 start_codon:yes stop_codon:yes gene_type:complete